MAAPMSLGLGRSVLETCFTRLSLGAAGVQVPFIGTASRAVPSAVSLAVVNFTKSNGIHTSSSTQAWEKPRGPKYWLLNNKTKFTPTPLGEQERPAYVCHMKQNIKYSPDKLWYVACLVRGMKIDEAINQLKFVHKKGAVAVREALEEAQQLAVQNHNVEFRSNLWVSESFVGKGPVIKGFRRHAKRRFGHIKYKYCHYFVNLEEGDPPEHYYPHRKLLSPEEMLQEWMDLQRKRRVPISL